MFFEIFEKYMVLFHKIQRILWKKEGVGVFQENCKKYHGTLSNSIIPILYDLSKNLGSFFKSCVWKSIKETIAVMKCSENITVDKLPL